MPDIAWVVDNQRTGGKYQSEAIAEYVDVTRVRQTPIGVPDGVNPPAYMEDEDGIVYPTTSLVRTLRELDPDITVFHCFGNSGIDAAPEVASFSTTVLRIGTNTQETAVVKPGDLEFFLKYVTAFDHIVAASEIAKHRTMASGVDPERITVIPTAVSFADADVYEPRRDVPHHIGLCQRLAPMKNPIMPVFAIHALNEIEPTLNPRLFVAGTGSVAEDILSTAKELRVGIDRIQMAGWVSPAKNFIQQQGIYLLPSLTENMPQSVLEAAQAGVCSVVADAAWTDQFESLVTYPGGDPWALAEVLRDLLTNEARRYNIAERQQEEAAQKFDIARIGQRYEWLFKGLHDDLGKFKLPSRVKA